MSYSKIEPGSHVVGLMSQTELRELDEIAVVEALKHFEVGHSWMSEGQQVGLVAENQAFVASPLPSLEAILYLIQDYSVAPELWKYCWKLFVGRRQSNYPDRWQNLQS